MRGKLRSATTNSLPLLYFKRQDNEREYLFAQRNVCVHTDVKRLARQPTCTFLQRERGIGRGLICILRDSTVCIGLCGMFPFLFLKSDSHLAQEH